MISWGNIRLALEQRPPRRIAEQFRARAAVALALRERWGAPGLELLFIRRAEHPRDPWSGQIGFPGGRSEPQDDSLETTATRETAEEVGLDLRRCAEPLGRLDEVQAMARARVLKLSIQPFVFRVRERMPTRLSDEVTSVHWLALDALLHRSARGRKDYASGGGTVRLPCVRLEGLTIWGLTHRMLMDLDERLQAARRVPGGAAS